MATYVNDLRLTELATGEGSGTWGTTTNTNLELIGEALGYGTQDCFASDADATTTVADGVSDPARAMYFKVTSSATLTATRTLTIDPNTVSRVMLIENATTGSQSIAISQGSGGNVTIASGQTKMVYLDGAGSGAAVVDALADLELGTITVADLTATTADINGGTIDGVTIGGSSAGAGTFTNLTATGTTTLAGASTSADITFGDNDKAIFGAGSDLQIYHDGSNSYIDDAGTGLLRLRSNTIYLEKYTGELLADFNADGYVSLLHDNSEKFRTTSTGIDVTGTVTADGLTVSDGTETTSIPATADRVAFTGASSNFVQSDTALFIQPTGDLVLNGTGAEIMRLKSGNVGIGTSSPDTLLHLSSTSGNAILRLERNDADVTSGEVIGEIQFETQDNSGGGAAGGIRSKITAEAEGAAGQTALTFETAGIDASLAERMRIDSSGNVGIGTSSPARALHISTSADRIAKFESTDAGAFIVLEDSNSTSDYNRIGVTTHDMQFITNNSEAMRIDSSQNLLVGRTSTIIFSANTTTGAVINEGGRIDAAADGQAPLIIQRLNSDGNIANFYKDATTVGSIGAYSSGLYIGSTAGSDAFIGFTNSIVYPSTSAGVGRDAAIDLGSSGSRFKDLYLSGGVYLGGTGAANLLDDYEEGTWTPVVKDSSVTGTILGINTINCKYTKIGKVVTITGQITRNDATSLTGTVYFTGLPFTQSNGQQMGGSMWIDNSSSDVLGLITGPDQSYFNVRKVNAPNNYLTTDEWNNARPVYFSRTYYTAG